MRRGAMGGKGDVSREIWKGKGVGTKGRWRSDGGKRENIDDGHWGRDEVDSGILKHGQIWLGRIVNGGENGIGNMGDRRM